MYYWPDLESMCWVVWWVRTSSLVQNCKQSIGFDKKNHIVYSTLTCDEEILSQFLSVIYKVLKVTELIVLLKARLAVGVGLKPFNIFWPTKLERPIKFVVTNKMLQSHHIFTKVQVVFNKTKHSLLKDARSPGNWVDWAAQNEPPAWWST